MTKSLASKTAGLRLLLIMTILAVPMVFFGSNYLLQAKRDIGVLEREILGTELTQIVMALHLAKVEQLPAESLVRIKELEQLLGIREEENLERYFNKTVVDSDDNNNGLRGPLGYISDVATVSGLVLDSDEASYHLATSLTVSLPILIGHSNEVITQLNLKDSGLNKRFQLAVLLGHLKAATEKLKESIQRSKSAANQPVDYVIIESSAKKIESATVQFGNQFMFGMASGDDAVLRQQVSEMRSAAEIMLVPSYDLLNRNLFERKKSAQNRLLYMSALGFLNALIALGMAASMFSKTLKRLDEVEVAQKRSEELRVETDRINEEVALLNVNLSQKLTQLKSAQDELLKKGKMEQLGQLTATVAHEIRNPLGAVRTSAFLIGRKLQGKNTGVEPQLDRINNGITRCDAIITQLLDFSRTKQVETQAVKLDEWLEKVLLEECESLPAAVAVDCQLGLDSTEVHFDGTRLRRAVLNLVTNACEAMVGKGSDVAETPTTRPKVSVTTRIVGHEVCIEVADNGPGMAADVLVRIREPLFTTKNFGTGLGVPAVEQIAVQHGGRLEIQSTPGVGSTFTICLPLVNPSESAAA